MCRGERPERGLLYEPWLYADLVHEHVAQRKQAAWQRGQLIDAKSTPPFGLLKVRMLRDPRASVQPRAPRLISGMRACTDAARGGV